MGKYYSVVIWTDKPIPLVKAALKMIVDSVDVFSLDKSALRLTWE